MDFLVFQLQAPLAAWGDIAVGECRPTMAYPGQSALLGLLAAALGVRREDAEAQVVAPADGWVLLCAIYPSVSSRRRFLVSLLKIS